MSLLKIEVGRSIWIRLVVALAILVIPATLYFFTYFNTKYDFAIQQRFRALNELEHQFNRGLSNFDNLFRFSKSKEFTQTERQEATKVVSDFWAYLEAWESWAIDQKTQQITSENQSRYRVLHVEEEALQSELDSQKQILADLSYGSSELDDFLEKQIYGLNPSLEKRKREAGEDPFLKEYYLRALNSIISDKNRGSEDREKLKAFAEQLKTVGDEKSKKNKELIGNISELEERLKRIEQELTGISSDGTNSGKLKSNARPPALLKGEELTKWKKYIHEDIETWLNPDYEDYILSCLHNDSPTKASKELCDTTTLKKAKAEESIRKLQLKLAAINNYLQEIGTSAVYANTRYDVVKRVRCGPDSKNSNSTDSDSADYRASRFKVITSGEPFRLSVEDACINEVRTIGTKGVLEAQIPLSDLIQPDSALRYFDQILILNAQGLVVYRSGQEDRISVDNDSGLPQQANRNDFARFTDLSGLLAKAATDDSILELNKNKSSSGKLTGSFSRVVEEPVGDMSHLFFLQPLRPSVGEQTNVTGASKPWHVIGVVRKSQLLTDVSRVSLNAMAALLIVLLLMLLSTPLLKLRFATLTEPVSTAQVFLIGTSLILGTCIITLILLDMRAYAGLKDRMDATAEQISLRMRAQFKEELHTSISENKKAFLDELGVSIAGNKTAASDEPGESTARSKTPAPTTGTVLVRQQTSSDSTEASTGEKCDRDNKSETLSNAGFQQNKLKINDIKGKTYPPFELAYLLDAEGNQVGSQRTYRQEFSESISVPKRQYFLHSRDGPLWQKSTSDEASNEKFFLERIFTYDHGYWLTALSTPVTKNDPVDVPCAARVRVTLRVMQSFFATVLPPSFGFAVLEDASGEVIYHSDNSRSLLENFYVETDNNESLITAVHSRRHDEITGTYYGQGHRFYVAPLDDTPWSLVVFYDKTLIRTLNFEILIGTVTAQIFYALIIFGGLLVFRWISLHKRWRFIWPRPAVLREYRYLALILLLGQGLAWLVVDNPDEKYNLYTLVAFPLFTLSLISYLLDQKHHLRSTTVSYHIKRSVTTIFLLAGILAISFSSFRPEFNASHKVQVALLLLAVLLLVSVSRLLQKYVPEKNLPGQEKVVRFWYLTCAMLVLVLVSVWPTKLLFDDIFQLQADKLLRMSQHHVLQQVDRRRDAIKNDLARIDSGHHGSFKDTYVGRYLTPDIYVTPASELPETETPTSKLPEAVTSPPYTTLNSGKYCSKTKPKKMSEFYSKHPVSFLTENFPSYSPLSSWLHVMFFEQAGDLNWCAKTQDGKLSFMKTSAIDNGTYEIESKQIPMEYSVDPEIKMSFYGGLIFLFFLMLYALRTISRRILGLDFPVIRTHWDLENIEEKIEDWRGTRRVVLAPSPEFINKLKPHLSELGEVSELDLSSSEGQQKLLDLAAHMDREDPDVALLKSPKFFSCGRETREQLLQALEELDACPQTTLILCTGLFPWLNLALADEQLAYNDFSDEERMRWQTLLGNFQSGHASLDTMTKLTSIEALLHYECRNTELEEIRLSIELEPAFLRAVELQKNPWQNIFRTFWGYFKNSAPGEDILTSKELVDDVTQRARHFHKSLWQCCNEEEKYILYRMAQGHMINSLHRKLLERLLRLGLIRKDPDFRISSYSLQNFILSEGSPEQAKAWEKQTPASIWTHLRVPLLMLLLTLFVFLAYVGPNVIESILGLIPAIILALPLVMRFLPGGRKK